MREQSGAEVKRLKEIEAGTLVVASPYGEQSVGLVTEQRHDDMTLVAWLVGKDATEPYLQYADDGLFCLSYGMKWQLKTSKPEPGQAKIGSVAAYADGWLIRLPGDHQQQDWWNLEGMKKVNPPSENRLFVFPSYEIAVKLKDRDDLVTFYSFKG